MRYWFIIIKRPSPITAEHWKTSFLTARSTNINHVFVYLRLTKTSHLCDLVLCKIICSLHTLYSPYKHSVHAGQIKQHVADWPDLTALHQPAVLLLRSTSLSIQLAASIHNGGLHARNGVVTINGARFARPAHCHCAHCVELLIIYHLRWTRWGLTILYIYMACPLNTGRYRTKRWVPFPVLAQEANLTVCNGRSVSTDDGFRWTFPFAN